MKPNSGSPGLLGFPRVRGYSNPSRESSQDGGHLSPRVRGLSNPSRQPSQDGDHPSPRVRGSIVRLVVGATCFGGSPQFDSVCHVNVVCLRRRFRFRRVCGGYPMADAQAGAVRSSGTASLCCPAVVTSRHQTGKRKRALVCPHGRRLSPSFFRSGLPILPERLLE